MPAVLAIAGNVPDSIPKLTTERIVETTTTTSGDLPEAARALSYQNANEPSLQVTSASMTHLLLSETEKTSPDNDRPLSLADGRFTIAQDNDSDSPRSLVDTALVDSDRISCRISRERIFVTTLRPRTCVSHCSGSDWKNCTGIPDAHTV